MPNHVRNIVKMEGIAALPLFVIEDGEKRFDFNKMIPMPESLNIESGSMTNEAIIYYVTDKCTLSMRTISADDKELVDKKVNNYFSKGSWAEEVFMRVLEKTQDMPVAKKEEFYKMGQKYVSNIRKYGHATWYNWCIEHWGTKWNAYSNEQEDEDTIIFETAWSNPAPVIQKLSEMYPEATIEH